jgi:hypothetical protein
VSGIRNSKELSCRFDDIWRSKADESVSGVTGSAMSVSSEHSPTDGEMLGMA